MKLKTNFHKKDLRKIMDHTDIENEEGLYFPVNIEFNDIILLLEIIYPILEFEIYEGKELCKTKKGFIGSYTT